ncbi:MAG: hypothetical protein QXT53_01445 [Ignisphaera sp.]
MPRSKRSKEETAEATDSKYKSRSRASNKKRFVDTEEWVSRHVSDLISSIGLEFLNLSNDEYITVFTRIVDVLRGESSTLDLDTIIRRIRRNLDKVYPMIASAILELREQLDEAQLEFVINNIGDSVLAYAPRLYNDALRFGRTDLIERLRDLWRHTWLSKRYPVLPLQCPRCGFNSLMPDLSCLVCGASISEGELKKSINFKNMITEFAYKESLDGVKKALSYGYVYLSSIGIKPPSEAKDVLDIEILLTNEERNILLDILKQREKQDGY